MAGVASVPDTTPTASNAGKLPRRKLSASPSWRYFRRDYAALAGLVVILCLIGMSSLASVLAPYDPNAVDLYQTSSPPSTSHWMGTDSLGRDVFSRLLYATRISMSIGVFTALVAVLVGTVLGAVAGMYRGLPDTVIGYLINIALSVPLLPMVMVVGAFVTMTPTRLIVVIALLSWMTVARLLRGELLSLREREFVEAARCSGASDLRIIVRHLLPNATAPIIVAVTLLIPYAVLVESALSFLGFGVPPPTATAGSMLQTAQPYIQTAPWLAIFPGLMITIMVISFNLLGDGLRDALDPRRVVR